MSDFDKEAEREKLREKYEQDKKEREATQRMSDLLLKGATMTNAHCGTCGDPLFQQNGTTFCPSCHGNPDAVEGTDLEAQPAEGSVPEGSADGGAEASSSDTAASGADAAEPATTGDAASTDPRRGDRAPATDDAAPSSAADRTPSDPPQSERRQPTEPTADDRSSDPEPPRRAPAASPSSVDGDLEAARDALVRSLERFAEEAAATDDPRYARDCLAAAREAGEALSTLR
ncbi:hypothetical protein A6E15_15820 [Natrinema saccharevitans]|uniref:Uncharacterized protein n=1 Tax=Natrinema saccharevitans TaxID=301967 RepID=A0A1S8B162_9EURY|nr:Sjogren's syndrome/scleroderma autoantigen 1 family protein [Natrinema saccharevitans]OLZ42344.1 hypothetical protein A6E15_15820 [Natrinema saccharevitans]